MKIGLIIPLAEDDSTNTTPGYSFLRDYARQAESIGLDSIWVFDHLLYRWPNKPDTYGIWESWTLLTALAEATQKVELGTLVLCVPFRNPALLAKMATTLDEISNGRLILGLGAGWHQPEFEAFDYSFDHLASRFDEALQIIVPLVRDGAVDFQGRYYSANTCVIRPRGPRPNGPPILIASSGPRMLALTAQYADQWNSAWFGQVESLAESRGKLGEACRSVGRDPATVAITVGVNIAYPQAGAEPPPARKALSGSPEQIATELQRYAEAGVAHVICNLDPATPETLAEFGKAVGHVRR